MPHHKAYIGIPASKTFRHHLNQFFAAVDQQDPSANQHYIAAIEHLTSEVVDRLLLKTIEVADINTVGKKILNLCASTARKASDSLTYRVYKKSSAQEMQAVAQLWRRYLHQANHKGKQKWYLLVELDPALEAEVDRLLACKANNNQFNLSQRKTDIAVYETLITLMIDHFFMQASTLVKINTINKKMLAVGIDSVKAATHSALHKVVSKLNNNEFGAYAEQVLESYLKLSENGEIVAQPAKPLATEPV